MNPSNMPLELMHIEIRHEEMIQAAAQSRLVREVLEAQPEKGGILQSVRALFSPQRTAEAVPVVQPHPVTVKSKGKATPRTA